MLKKYRYLLIIVSSIIIGLVLYRNCSGKINKPFPITYDKQYVKELRKVNENSSFWKECGFLLKKVDELEDSLSEVYNVTGENGIGWNREPGDFVRIKLKLRNRRTMQFDHLGGWIKVLEKSEYFDRSIADSLKIPANSTKIKLHPYGVTLDMGEGDQILMLFGIKYNTDPAALLTLIYVGKDTAEMIFNKHFDVFEIREQNQGYSLIGRMYWEGSHADPYEITIKDGKLTMEKLPLQKVYESQEPHIILQNSIGWSYDKQPGEFTRLEIAAPPRSKDPENQVFNVASYNDTWTSFSAPVTIPTDTTTIKQTSHFIILENLVGRIIILNGKNDKESTPACLTILRSAPYYPDRLFNDYFHLQEITEDDIAYHLLGTRKDAEDPNKIYELTIDKAAMSEVKRKW
jgi:hypothetical protein